MYHKPFKLKGTNLEKINLLQTNPKESDFNGKKVQTLLLEELFLISLCWKNALCKVINITKPGIRNNVIFPSYGMNHVPFKKKVCLSDYGSRELYTFSQYCVYHTPRYYHIRVNICRC